MKYICKIYWEMSTEIHLEAKNREEAHKLALEHAPSPGEIATADIVPDSIDHEECDTFAITGG